MAPTSPSIRRRARSGRAAAITLLLVACLAGLAWAGARLLGSDEARAAVPPALVGINLAGAEFGPPPGRPATYGKDYTYPDAAVAAPFLAQGMNTARLPVLWERLQPRPFAPLDPAEMARVDGALAALAGYDAVILDIHNYAQYRGVRLTGDGRSRAMLADLWTRLAQRYRANRHLVYGLMNEPVNVPAAAWRRIAEASVTAIRAAGVHNLILVPGTNWTGAHSWTSGGADSNAAAFAGFRDPANNFAFDMHQYFDRDSSGSNPVCIASDFEAVSRLTDATAWLRAQKQRGFLGEFGVGPDPHCLEQLDRVLDFVDRNSDVWLGWTIWAAGGWWGNYAFSVQPDGDRQKPQMAVLKKHIGRH